MFINKILLTGEVFVFTSQGVDNFATFVELSLVLVRLCSIRPRLFLCVVQLSLKVEHLAFPLVDESVELPLSLLVLSDDILTLCTPTCSDVACTECINYAYYVVSGTKTTVGLDD